MVLCIYSKAILLLYKERDMKINQAQVGIIFMPDKEIVFTIGGSLKKLQEKYKGNVQLLNNIPEFASPDTPRIIYGSSNFLINVSLMRLDIVINLPIHIASSYDKVLVYVNSIIYDIATIVVDDNVKYDWTGLILTIEYPKSGEKNKSSLTYSAPVFDRIVKIDRNEKQLASFGLQYGFLEDSYYINYNIGGYEKINIQMPSLPISIQQLSNPNTEIIESGISITIDINNRPHTTKKKYFEDFTDIAKMAEKKLKSVIADTNLSGLL
jgi:hypothetical protein